MGIKAKALGNALANKLRGFEDKTSNQVDPGNMPAPPDMEMPAEGIPPVEELTPEIPAEGAPAEVPTTILPDAMEGDTYVVQMVSPDSVTLVKQPGAAPETAAPMPPL
jgi:hypothetical protein